MSNFNIMLFSVETKKFSLKRNFEKERKEREAAEKACLDALAQMEGFNRSEPTSEASEMTTKSKKKREKESTVGNRRISNTMHRNNLD